MSVQAKFNYSSYFLKILRPLHYGMRISKDAKDQLNLFVNLVIDKLTKKAIFLTKNNFSDKKSMRKPKTLSNKDFIAATEIIFTGEIRKHARVWGGTAVTKYAASEEGTKDKPIKKEKRAKVVIPISRVENQIKTFLAKGQYISEYSAVFLAGVIDYLCGEVLELAGNSAKEHGRKSIAPICVRTAIEGDDELAALSKKVKFKVSGGGI